MSCLPDDDGDFLLFLEAEKSLLAVIPECTDIG